MPRPSNHKGSRKFPDSSGSESVSVFDSHMRWQTQVADTRRDTRIAELAPIDGSHWELHLHPVEYRRALNPDLSSLTDSPLANNPFFNPAILAASRARITQDRICQMVVWEIQGERRIPRLSIALREIVGRSFSKPGLVSFTHPYAPLGDPLLGVGEQDAEHAELICERFVSLLAQAFADELPPIRLDYISAHSPLMRTIKTAFPTENIAIETRKSGARASINGSYQGRSESRSIADYLAISKKRMREFRRLEKKLRALGDVTFEKVSNPHDIVLRLEEFLLMETRSWKGRRGTSIHAIKRDAAFARQSVCDMAKEGRSEILSLRLNDVSIASIVLFHSNGHYFPWKICFAEGFSRYSPGTILMLKATQDIMQRPDFQRADSLAHFGQSWMSHLWPDETEFSTVVVAQNRDTAHKMMEHLSTTSRIKQTIKRLLGRN